MWSWLIHLFTGKRKISGLTSWKAVSLAHEIESEFWGFISLFSGVRNRRGMQYEFSDGKTIMVGESNRSLITIALATAITKARREWEAHKVKGALSMLQGAIEDAGGAPIHFETPEKVKWYIPFKINGKASINYFSALKRIISTDPDFQMTLPEVSNYFYSVLRKNT